MCRILAVRPTAGSLYPFWAGWRTHNFVQCCRLGLAAATGGRKVLAGALAAEDARGRVRKKPATGQEP